MRTPKRWTELDYFWRSAVTNKERQERAIRARRLCGNGVAIKVEDPWQDSVLRIRQVGMPEDSRAFDLGGGSGFSINLNIIVTNNNISISSIALNPIWEDPSIALFCDPEEIGARFSNYCFIGKKPIEFERGTVLNHRLIRPELFRAPARFQGLLLFTGLEPIPKAFAHGSVVAATLVVYDQFDVRYPFQFKLWVDRSNSWTPVKRTKNSRAPLLSKPDLFPK
jgi:hypothetical protein